MKTKPFWALPIGATFFHGCMKFEKISAFSAVFWDSHSGFRGHAFQFDALEEVKVYA